MYFREDAETAAELLKQAIPQMVKRKIPTNPWNIALWYAYAADRDKNLKQDLETQFPETEHYIPEKSEELFFDYFVKSYMLGDEGAKETLERLLGDLFGSVKRTEEGARQYGTALQQGIDKIRNERDPKEMEKALLSLLKDTETADTLTREFSDELDAAREEIESLKRQLKATEKSAFVDGLTQIGNRREFDRNLTALLAKSDAQPCLIMIDLDHFKKCNDNYGHLTGDRILSAMGQLLQGVRQEHVRVARYGGEEFAVLLSQGCITDAKTLAESIRVQVEKIQIKQRERCIDNISASFGIARLRPGESRESLIERADQALYLAKRNGRNRVECAD